MSPSAGCGHWSARASVGQAVQLCLAATEREPSNGTSRSAALYRHFGRSLSLLAADRIRQLVAAKPNGGYGARRSSLEEYGLDPALERERYAGYMRHFEIRPEREARRSRAAKISASLAPGQSCETKVTQSIAPG